VIWENSPIEYRYRWLRCNAGGNNCLLLSADGQTFRLHDIDVGHTLRLRVTAINADGETNARSEPSDVVAPNTAPLTNTSRPTRPTIRILGVKFLGARIYVRMRICDDQQRNLAILVRETKPGVRPALRRFATRVAPRPCGAYTRNWLPAQRFRGPGRYTITLRARDVSGFTSFPVRRTFRR
jgi:hypothetical protein